MNKVRFTNWDYFIQLQIAMITRMFSSCFKQIQIFKSIIVFNSVDMMNSFGFIKKSIQVFFNNQNMFKNIITIVGAWVYRFNQFITICANSSTFTHSYILTFTRTVFSVSFFNSIGKAFKFFTANNTNSIQNKRLSAENSHTFFRATLSPSFKLRWIKLNRFLTDYASSLNFFRFSSHENKLKIVNQSIT